MDAVRLFVCVVVAVVAGLLGSRIVDRVRTDRPLFDSGGGGRRRSRNLAFVGAAIVVAPVVSWRFGDAAWFEMIAYVALFMVLFALSWIDATEYRLPDVIVVPTFVVGVVVVVAVSLIDSTPERIRWALVGAAVAFVVLLVAHLVSPRGMGFGDVKLAAVLGLATGWQASSMGDAVVLVLWLLLIGFAAGTVAGIVLLVARRRNQPFPFGPFLAFGTVVTVLASRTLLG